MEVREIVKIVDPNDPHRLLTVHLTEEEVHEVMQAGLFYLLKTGYISFKQVTEPDQEIDLPEDATVQ